MVEQASSRPWRRALLLGAAIGGGAAVARMSGHRPETPPQSKAFVEVAVPDQTLGSRPVEAASLSARWPALATLPTDQQGEVTAALNSAPAPCPPCADPPISLAECALAPPVGCENVASLVARAARERAAGASLTRLVSVLSYPDHWIADAAGEQSAAVRLELWVDPASPLLGPSLEALDGLRAAGTPFDLSLRLALDGRWPAEEPLALAALAAEEQGMLEPWLRALAAARARQSAPEAGSTQGSSQDIPGSLEALVTELFTDPALSGLDQGRWQQARRAADTAARLAEAQRAATGARGVRATPAWFINGYRLRGLQSTEALSRVLTREAADRAAGGAPWGP